MRNKIIKTKENGNDDKTAISALRNFPRYLIRSKALRASGVARINGTFLKRPVDIAFFFI